MDIFSHPLPATRLRSTIYFSAPTRLKIIRPANTALSLHKQTKGITLYWHKHPRPYIDAPCGQEIPFERRKPRD